VSGANTVAADLGLVIIEMWWLSGG